jgi:hypothetical protein
LIQQYHLHPKVILGLLAYLLGLILLDLMMVPDSNKVGKSTLLHPLVEQHLPLVEHLPLEKQYLLPVEHPPLVEHLPLVKHLPLMEHLKQLLQLHLLQTPLLQ